MRVLIAVVLEELIAVSPSHGILVLVIVLMFVRVVVPEVGLPFSMHPGPQQLTGRKSTGP
jgi:hypothetical protein